jgi:hypothetical protein
MKISKKICAPRLSFKKLSSQFPVAERSNTQRREAALGYPEGVSSFRFPVSSPDLDPAFSIQHSALSTQPKKEQQARKAATSNKPERQQQATSLK